MQSYYRKSRKLLPRWLLPSLAFLLFIAAWQLAVEYYSVPEYLVPPPSKIAIVIRENFSTLLKDSLVTSAEAFLGFIIANCLSLVTAILFCYSSVAEKSLYPFIIALKSVPVIAMTPLLIIWFGYGHFSNILMAAIIAFFPLVVNATIGMKSISKNHLDLLTTLSASKLQIFKELRFPNAVPYIVSALKISAPLSVMGAITAEMTGAINGIGASITFSSMNIDSPLLFASILFASLIGFLFFVAIIIFEKYLI